MAQMVFLTYKNSSKAVLNFLNAEIFIFTLQILNFLAFS